MIDRKREEARSWLLGKLNTLNDGTILRVKNSGGIRILERQDQISQIEPVTDSHVQPTAPHSAAFRLNSSSSNAGTDYDPFNIERPEVEYPLSTTRNMAHLNLDEDSLSRSGFNQLARFGLITNSESIQDVNLTRLAEELQGCIRKPIDNINFGLILGLVLRQIRADDLVDEYLKYLQISPATVQNKIELQKYIMACAVEILMVFEDIVGKRLFACYNPQLERILDFLYPRIEADNSDQRSTISANLGTAARAAYDKYVSGSMTIYRR